MGRQLRPFLLLSVILAVFGMLSISSVLAATWTDKGDYSPGSTVTISGDDSDGAGYLAGETVHVDVTGPNGYTAACDTVADEAGAWTCQIILWDDDRAIGSYNYVAVGLESGVSQTGAFTDARNWVLTFAGTGSGSVTITISAGTVNAPTSCGGSGTNATSQTVTSTCSPNISTSDNNAVVTFSASAAGGSTFAGWSGQANLTSSPAPGCTATNNPCSVVIGSNGALTVTFNVAATATPTPSATSTPTHTPTNTATHTPTLTPTHTPTDTATFTPTHTPTNTPTPTPTNVPPTADIGGPYTGDEGASIALDASASSDADGTIVSYAWDLDNDAAYDDDTGPTPTVTFPDDGTYTIGLQVTDDDGATDSDSTTVTVNNLDPVITNVDASPSTVDEGNSSTITVTASDVPADTLSYEFDCDGDLAYEVGPQAANSTSCAFPDGDDTVAVGVRVTDEDGGEATDGVSVTVNNLDPALTNVEASPSTVDEGNSSVIQVTATDVPADVPDLLYSFDCEDDGTYDFIDQADDYAGCSFPDGPATVTVRVRVDDQDGGVATDTVDITVNNLDPIILAVGAVPSTVNEGSSSTVSVSATDVAADLPDLLYSFDCDGDASYEVGPQASSFAACSFPDGPATVSVGVLVDDQDGGSDTGTVSITVLNVAPTVNAGADQGTTWTAGGTAITLLAPPSFSDPGTDTHTCSVAWDDGNTSSGTVTESVGNPTTGTCAAAHTYAFPGVYDVAVTVCDSDGDCGSDALVIAIGLNFYGFTQPLNDPAVSTATPSVWKRGSNIPLKFQLRDAAGVPIPDSIATAIVAACSSGDGSRVRITKLLNGAIDNLLTALETETSSSPTADGGVCFRYDSTANQFIYNLGTKTSFYTALPDTYRATATVAFNGGIIASHTQANTFGLK